MKVVIDHLEEEFSLHLIEGNLFQVEDINQNNSDSKANEYHQNE